MKKLLIGIGIFGVLILYSFWARHEQPTIARPSALAATPTTTAPATNTCTTLATPPPAPTRFGDDEEGEDDGRARRVSSQSAATGSGLCTPATPSTPTTPTNGQYKNGTFTGTVADAYYGSVQVSATISGGKLTTVTFLQYPDTHSDSIMINHQAIPYLQQEAIQAQSAQVQIVSGATFTSQAFMQSLSSALSQAKA